MAYSLEARLGAIFQARERADSTTSPGSATQGNGRTYDQYGIEAFLNASSFPPIAGQVADLSHTLAGTTKDFDLTAIPWAGDVTKTFDATGKKIVAIILNFHRSNNAAGILFGTQGANGYGLFGTIVPRFYPGFKQILFLGDPANTTSPTNNLPAVAAGAKDLRFTGAVADNWKCHVLFSA